MKRVLIVSPHFPPTNAPDHQRTRLMLPWMEDYGWAAEVLAVEANECLLTLDPALAEVHPDSVPVHRVGALPRKLTQKFGFGSVGLRARPMIRAAGDRLLATGRFDAVFFSTTAFDLFPLAARWKDRFGLPMVLDYQDPWITDYYSKPGGPPPPGGKLKYGLSRRRAVVGEPKALAATDHVISVSPGYIDQLRDRYPSLTGWRGTTIPFGAPTHDLAVASGTSAANPLFDPGDGLKHVVCIGAVGERMQPNLRRLFQGLRIAHDSDADLFADLRVHFAGTSYASDALARPSVMPIAREAGIEHLVTEQTSRMGYFESLRAHRESAGLLVLGTEDPAYTPSKLFICLLCGPPVIGVFHEDGPAAALYREAGGPALCLYGSGVPPQESVAQCARAWRRLMDGLLAPSDPEALARGPLAPHTDRAMTERVCTVLDGVVPG